MERHIEFNIDEFYHIYQRGNNRGVIFNKMIMIVIILLNCYFSVIVKEA